ncbi:Eukaryotic translation initiation factor 3 subunit K, partial [Fragariocoptes setiger]
MSELTKASIAAKLKGIERYNPKNIDVLVEYLNEQCASNQYDLEANLALLKLYQFNPDQFSPSIVEKVLLKAVTNLPHPDFILCKCLLDPSKLESGDIQKINEIFKTLELCQFEEFWTNLDSNKDLIQDIEGFEDSVRKFVSHVVGITYQHIATSLLRKLLGCTSDEQFTTWLNKNNWKLEGEYVLVEEQEDKIKTINITEKIELEHVASVLATYR